MGLVLPIQQQVVEARGGAQTAEGLCGVQADGALQVCLVFPSQRAKFDEKRNDAKDETQKVLAEAEIKWSVETP